MSATLRIAVLGAPGTGRTQLVRHLQAEFSSALMLIDAPPGPWHNCFDLALLMGLDLHPEHRSASHRQTDQDLRAQLTQQDLPFALVYGCDAARSANAIQAIRFHMRDTPPPLAQSGRWRWPCEKCSDPECEHRLFSALLQPQREGLPPQG